MTNGISGDMSMENHAGLAREHQGNLGQIGVVVLNWNGWRDTIACLKSLLAVDDMRICVVDNASSDASVLNIVKWLSENSDDFTSSVVTSASLSQDLDSAARVTLIKNDNNAGFAGGMNLGIKFFMRQTSIKFLWLINNDTEIQPDAPMHLLSAAIADPGVGIWGCAVNWYDRPNEIQVAGGCVFDWKRARGIARLDLDTPKDGPFDYIAGCSMFVPLEFVIDVGLMSEEYFLYFEEIDWAQRGKPHWRLAWVREAVVYHKEGASIGSSTHSRPSDLSLHYITRNRLRFTAKFAGQWHNRVRQRIAYELLVYLKRRDAAAARILLSALGRDILVSQRNASGN